MVLLTVVATGVCASVVVAALPRLTAACIARSVRRAVRDQNKCNEAFKAAVKIAARLDPEDHIAAIFWGRGARAGLQEGCIEAVQRPALALAAVASIDSLMRDDTLKDIIRKGVFKAVYDVELHLAVKKFFIGLAWDEDLQDALIQFLRSLVKNGVREGIEDTELKLIIANAVRDAVENSDISDILRLAVGRALADEDLHTAAARGLRGALNPLGDMQFDVPEWEDLRRSYPRTAELAEGLQITGDNMVAAAGAGSRGHLPFCGAPMRRRRRQPTDSNANGEVDQSGNDSSGTCTDDDEGGGRDAIGSRGQLRWNDVEGILGSWLPTEGSMRRTNSASSLVNYSDWLPNREDVKAWLPPRPTGTEIFGEWLGGSTPSSALGSRDLSRPTCQVPQVHTGDETQPNDEIITVDLDEPYRSPSASPAESTQTPPPRIVITPL